MSTLVILAGGFGTRFGGPKQFFPLGPHGECLLHYGIYDAQLAGFNRFVLLTREELQSHVDEAVTPLLNGKANVMTAYQEAPDGKAKGTAHALMACREAVEGQAFGLVNADDFYGRQSYVDLATTLARRQGPRQATSIAYPAGATLSPNGGVSRALLDPESPFEQKIREIFNVRRTEEGIRGEVDGEVIEMDERTPVSMNMFGFSGDAFDDLEKFVARREAEFPDKEMLLPQFLNDEMNAGNWTLEVVTTDSPWFGMTYLQEKDDVIERLARLHAESVYPERLW